MAEDLLKAVHLGKSYRMDHQVLEVLKDVSLTVAGGDMTVIVGPSGAGKSTLLHVLGGLDRPTEGTVTLEGEDLNRMSGAARARARNEKIGFVFQFYHLIAEMTCLENVMLPGLVGGKSRGALRSEAAGLLAELGLADRAGHRPNQLSGGEQQRCAIARALINRPRLLLADEPTGNLDRQTSRAIFDLLLKIRRTRNVAMVMVTHDEELAQICPRKIAMLDGKLMYAR